MNKILTTSLSLILSTTLIFSGISYTNVFAQNIISDNSISENGVRSSMPQVARASADTTTITLSVKSGSDISDPLQRALSTAAENATDDAPYTVVVPAGSYTITKTLSIYSNTTLSMYGATIRTTSATGDLHMLILGDNTYNSSSACAGYYGHRNITVEGGTFIADDKNEYTQFRLMHATNITLKDVTISGGNGDHQIEAAAMKNFSVDGCTFKDMQDSTYTQSREALQLDLAVDDEIYPNIYNDGTMMENVTIQNCTFDNVCRGIGSHSMLMNGYFENVKIINNTFTDIQRECIVGVNYRNVEISGNTMTNCAGGISLQYCRGLPTTIYTMIFDGTVPYSGTLKRDAKAVIKNNTITAKYQGLSERIVGIELYGRKITTAEVNTKDNSTIPAGDYYISDVEVANNKITTGGYGILLIDAKKCTLTNNTITCKGFSSSDSISKKGSYDGITLTSASTDNIVCSNTIVGAQANGIVLDNRSSAAEITGNTIKKSGKNGIYVVGGKVTENIANNTVSSSGQTGINVYTSCTVGGNITGNTVSDSSGNGIALGGASALKGGITDNVTINSAKTGLQIIDHAIVEGGITNNKVDKSSINGIGVVESSTVNGNIQSNTVTNTTKVGISVGTKSAVLGSIRSNSVSSSKIYGISVAGNSTIGQYIDKNKINDSTKNGIHICDKSVVKKKISNNTIKNSKVHGISIVTSSDIKKGIEANTVTKAKKYGIYVNQKAKIGGKITLNKVSSCNIPIVVDDACKAIIQKNTISKNTNNYQRIAGSSIKVKTLKNTTFKSVTGKNKKITLNWKKVEKSAKIDGYVVELSTTKDFTKVSKSIQTTSTKATFIGLKEGKTYYIRICTYKNAGKAYIYSNYIKTKVTV